MINEKDLDKIKTWIVENIVKNVAHDGSRLAEKAEQELLEAQSSNSQYSSFYSVYNNERAIVKLRNSRGAITGTQIVAIPSSMRTNKKTGRRYNVRAHDRHYEDKRLFRLPNGRIVVQDELPRPVAERLLREGFFEALADRAQFFQGSTQRIQ